MTLQRRCAPGGGSGGLRHEALEIGFYALFVALAGAAYVIVQSRRDVAFKRRGFLVCGSLIWLLIGGFGL